MKQFTFNYLRRLVLMLLTVVGFTATTLAQEWENVTTVNYTSQEEIDNAKNDGSLIHKAKEDKPMVYQDEMIQVAFSGYTEYLAFKVDVNESGTYKMSLDMYNQDYLNEINFQFRYHSGSFSPSDGTLISPESIKWPLNNKTTVESNEFNLEPGTYYFAYHRNKFVDGMKKEHFNNFKLLKKKIVHTVTLNKPENGNLSVTYNNGTEDVTVSTETEAQTFDVENNTKLTVTATAAEGYELISLSPEMTKVAGSENVYEYTVTEAITIQAKFIQVPEGAIRPTNTGIKYSTDKITYLYQITDSRSSEDGKSDFYWTLGSHNGYNAIQTTTEVLSEEDANKQYFYFKEGSDTLHFQIYTADGKNIDYVEGLTGNGWNGGNIGSDVMAEYMQYDTETSGEFILISTGKSNEYGIIASNGDLLNTRGTGNTGFVNMSWVINTYSGNNTDDNGSRFKFIEIGSNMPSITVKKPVNGNLVISYTVNDEMQSIETYSFENDSEVFSIPEGTLLNVSANPESDYELDQILPEGMVEKTGKAGNKYYEYTVTGDATIEATFKPIQYGKVSAETPKEGTIEIQVKDPMRGSWGTADEFFLEQIEFGTELRAKVEANTGYNLVSVMKNQEELSTEEEGYYYFTVDAEEITISALFEAEEYTLTTEVNPKEGGSVSVTVDGESVEGTVKYRDVFTVTVTENTGYIHESTVVDGAEEIDGQAGIYTVKGNVTITVTFKKDTSSINSVENGTVYYNVEEEVLYTGAAKSVRVYDLSGRLVLNTENQENVSLAELAEGVYTAIIDGKIIKLNK